MGENQHRDLFYYAGHKFDIYYSSIERNYLLVVILKSIVDVDHFGLAAGMIYRVARLLEEIFTKSDAELAKMNDDETNNEINNEINNEEVDINVLPQDAPDVDFLFREADSKIPGPKDVDAYWNQAVEERTDGGMQNPDALSYDQARKLGLTPKDEDKDS
jgi:hypothetical protein